MYLANIFVSAVLTIIFSTLFIINMTNSSKDFILTIRKCLLLVSLVILLFLNNYIFKDLNRVLFNIFIIFILFLFLVFDSNYKKSIYYTMIYFIFCSIGEFLMALVSILIVFLLHIDITKITYITIIFTILNGLILLMISRISILSSIITKLYNKLNNKSYIFMIFSVFYIFLLCFNMKNNINYSDYYVVLFLYVFVIISIVFIYNNTIKRIKYENEYEVLQKSLSMYEKEVNRQGKKNHEYNNQLMVLKGYSNNPKKLNEYLDLLIEEHKGGQNFMIKQLGYLPDGGFKGLIYSKLALMEEKGIKSYLYVSSDLKKFLENIDIKYYSDLTKMFGIFVDNAIDAASIANKKEVVIDIKSEDDYLVIEISNTFNIKTDVNKIGKKGFTSKGIGHGFGLSIVKDIKNSRDLIDTYSEVDKDLFKQTIIAKIK